jgi:integrase
MRQIGRTTTQSSSAMFGRLLAARTDTPQARRPLHRARIRRVHALLHAYLNAAVRSGTITRNPASNVELESGRRSRPLVWTPNRVDRWRQTGRRPSASMVWTPEQAGAFLDFATRDRLYPLFHLVAYRGLRRGEALGLPWTDLDLDAGGLAVRDNLVDPADVDEDYEEFDDPKSAAGERTVSLDNQTVAALRAWRRRQKEERLAAGQAWIDSGRVFTKPTGEPLDPRTVSQHFDRLIDRTSRPAVSRTATTHAGTRCSRQATVEFEGQRRCGLQRHGGQAGHAVPLNRSGLPPIRFHDLRH